MRSTVFLFIFLSQVSIAWGLTPEQWFQEGNKFSAEGQFKEAVKVYKKSNTGNALSPVAHYNLGIAYKNLGQFDDAITSLEKSVKQSLIKMMKEMMNLYGNFQRIKKGLSTHFKISEDKLKVLFQYIYGKSETVTMYFFL